jgi:signal transduction histidine kinase/CheY-like chemotaxis protein
MAFNGVKSSFPMLATVSQSSSGPQPPFADAARPLLVNGVKTIGVAEERGGVLTVIASVGDGPVTGQALVGERASLGRRALGAQDLVSGFVADLPAKRLGVSLASGSQRRVVVYEESTVDLRPAPTPRGSPFSELNVAMYATPRADPSQLVFTTTAHMPGSGELVRRSVPVGADTWLLVASSKRPLVGSLVAQSQWVVLVVGLFIALLTALLVEVLGRRRTYALALVDERTSELQRALEEGSRLEAAERQARELAESANQSKSEFLSRMSHELRTPLNAVVGFAQLLELDDLTDTQREEVAQILKGGRHLLDLINEVLDISRIESGRFSVSAEPVLAAEVLGETIDLMRPLADHHKIQILGDPSCAGPSFVLADRQRLKQVLLNLSANAIKYNRSGGTVVLSCEPVADRRLRINVADTGPGIRPEHLGLLFSPFERLGAERTDIEGTGLGLPLSRRLAEAMGGTLGVATELGQGSTFWVELPRVEGPVERYQRLDAPSGDEANEAAAQPGQRPKVLYIEDNLSNLNLVERIFSQRGQVDLIVAMQGRLGLDLAREHRPALILLDLHLPDIGGDQVLEELRDDPATRTIPVVMISADATNGQIQRLVAAGARSYLTKPIDVRELLRLIDDTLGASL